MNILVFIQTNDNQINRMSLEALACAQNLNHSISAITFDEKAAEELSHYKLNEINDAFKFSEWLREGGTDVIRSVVLPK